MPDPYDGAYIGEIRLFGFNFAPVGWAMCNGQLLNINPDSQSLFSLLKNRFGGDGVHNFALPNLQSRVPIHQGQGAGLPRYSIGQAGGAEQVTIGQQHMPAHKHLVQATNRAAKHTDPAAHVLAQTAGHAYDGNTDGTTMNPEMITSAGGGQPISNIQPYLVLNFCIALQGMFPPGQ